MRSDAYQLNYLHEENHWWFLARREILLSVIATLIEQGQLPSPPMQILDYGCGTGGLTKALSVFGEVSGVDFSPEALDYCRKRHLNQVRSIQSPDELPSGQYDLLGSFDVLEHVEDDLGLLRHWRRAIKPEGLLFITVPAYRWLWSGEDTVSQHIRRYTYRELKTKAEAAGFDIVRLTYFNSLLFPAIAGVRLFNRFLRPHTLDRSDVAPASPPINTILCRVFAVERQILKKMNFPCGISLLLAARPKKEPDMPLHSSL